MHKSKTTHTNAIDTDNVRLQLTNPAVETLLATSSRHEEKRRSKLCLCDLRVDNLSPDMHHGPRRRYEVRFANVVPLFFLCHDAPNEFGQFIIARAAPHLRVQIMIPY